MEGETHRSIISRCVSIVKKTFFFGENPFFSFRCVAAVDCDKGG